MRYEEVQMRDLKHGDQIAVRGNVADLHPLLGSLVMIVGEHYYHHGIYDAHNMEVIHLTGDSKADAKPIKNDFTKFYAGHNQLFRVVYEDDEQCFSVEEVMKRAEDAVNRPTSWPGYDIIKNNCETFAFYLKTGKMYSKQASDALKKLIVTAVGVKIGCKIGGCS